MSRCASTFFSQLACISVGLLCDVNIYLVSKLECCVHLHDALVPTETPLNITLAPTHDKKAVAQQWLQTQTCFAGNVTALGYIYQYIV